MSLPETFDEQYFKDGVRTRKSLYENYQWVPSIAFSRAAAIKRLYPNKRILDFGCAMGYVVYALRCLGVDALGYDVSDYAVANAKPEVRPYIYSSFPEVPVVDVIIGKDVLEHIPYTRLREELEMIASKSYEACFIIPLGDSGKYRIPEYAYDPSHVIVEDEEWWCRMFSECGFSIKELDYTTAGIKERWLQHHPQGNVLFMLEVR